MITPRRTRLLRAAGLAELRAALTTAIGALDPVHASRTFIVVPTRAAAEQLRRTVEDRLLGERPALAWPHVGPRADLYRELLSRAASPIATLSGFDREVLLGRVAREVAASGLAPPFVVRPALIAEMLALYDHIRRQARTVEDFDRNLRLELEPAVETDRGAAQLLQQTAFLAATFEGYERHLEAHGLDDEHRARARLMAEPLLRPLHHVVVAVADRVGDADGLWPVDFTLLSTLPGLERLDVIATEGMLTAGFLERIHAALPDIEESALPAAGAAPPRLVVPSADGSPAFETRDREEELAAIARRIKQARLGGDAPPLHRQALIVRRPLPYLYLARSVFGGAGLPFETLDTLPLAAEPYAAAVDLVLEFVSSGFSRAATVALLRSPHFHFDDAGKRVSDGSIAALDRSMADVRYLGGLERLARLFAEWSAITAPGTRDDRRRQRAAAAARVAVTLARELAPLGDERAVTGQLAVLQGFLSRYQRTDDPASVEGARLARVRGAVHDALAALSRAYRAHDPDRTATGVSLAATIRRWLGAETFAVRTGLDGIRVLDAQAARFADVDEVQLVGLVEGEWPERTRRSIFYPPFLLGVLDPAPAADDPNQRESDQMAAARASFLDLLRLARARVRVSTFALESDAVVEPSTFVDDLATVDFERIVEPAIATLEVFADEALNATPPVLDALPATTRAWAVVRAAQPAPGERRGAGEAGPWTLPRVSVSRIDRYLKCPFQFFASEVLGLEEAPADEDSAPPWERGRFLHALFERFFREWQESGRGVITADLVLEARTRLVDVCERALASLPPGEAALERLRLFGSAAGAGIVDRVLAMEAARPTPIGRRLLEYELDNAFTLRRESGETRTVRLRAKVDRVDLLADDTFRVIDYKSKVVPDLKRTVQLQVYTSAVAQQLSADAAAPRVPSEAFYLSFEGDDPVKALKAPKGQTLDDTLRVAEARMLGAMDDIAAGHFPVRPAQRSQCAFCPFDGVCRKAFVEASDE